MSWFVDQKDEKRLLVNLENPNVKFTDLLRNVAIYKLVRDRNFSTLTYLSNHIQEIIDTCFPLNYDQFDTDKNFDWDDSSRSFLLFTKAPPSLLEALFQNDAIYTQMSLIFMKIHNGHRPPFFLLSRISSVLAFIVSNITNEVNNCIGFIYQLLPFKNEPGVFDIFEQICSSDESFVLMQKALIESHFSDHVLYEINKRQKLLIRSNKEKDEQKLQPNNSYTQKSNNESNTPEEVNIQLTSDPCSHENKIIYPDEIIINEQKEVSNTENETNPNETLSDNSQFVSNESLYFISEDDDPNHELHISLLLRIICLCNYNKILKETFCSHQIIGTLYSLIDSSIIVLNELWNTINSVVHIKNESKMIIFLPKAVENIKEPYETVLRYQIFSLEFIAKMMKLQSNGLSNDLIKQVQQVILRLIVQFPNSTNLIICIFKLIKYGIVWNEFSDQFIENFVPIMIVEGSSEIKTAAQAKSKHLLWKFCVKAKYKSLRSKITGKIDNFKEFCSSVLNKYNQVMNSSYGGEVQAVNKQSLFSTNFLIF